MRTGIVAFLIGNICYLFWPSGVVFLESQPILLITGLVFVLILILYKAQRVFVSSPAFIFPILAKHQIRPIAIIALCFWGGVLFTGFYVSQIYPHLDLQQIEGKTIEVKGYVDSIPRRTEEKQSFEFFITARLWPEKGFEKRPEKGSEKGSENKEPDNKILSDIISQKKQWDDSFSGKVRLSWYYTQQQLESGQQWQLKIRLKKPNGMLNGGFDYEQWLYQKRILATGYIRSGQQLKTPDDSLFETLLNTHLLSLRQKIANQLDLSLADYPYKGLVKALAIGLRHNIEAAQWQTFLRTGTNHLIAISGLHIGLLSSFIWLIVYQLWCSVSSLNLKYPATFVASVAALLAAIMYAALAGFAIPTQRALIMLSVVFMAIMFKREFLPSYILLLALLAVIVFDPLSTLSPGFWLSFGAVSIILLIVSSRLGFGTDKKDKLLQFGWLQLVIFIGLLPLLMLFFHQFSLISPIANLIAVPLMSLVIVPLTLIATALLFIFEPAALLVFELLQWPMDALFWCLDGLSQWSESLVYLAEPSWLVTLMVFFGSLWLLMPKGWHGRWLGVILFLPLFYVEAEKIPQGEVQLTVLDVGQGLAMVIRTRHHTLLYDTGDKYNEQFNMADKVIIPYLKLHGINTVDKLIISHSDRDHAGSYSELMAQLNIIEVLAGEPQQLKLKSPSVLDKNKMNIHASAEQCFLGQQWQWDNIQFRILSPQNPLQEKKGNNRSCVLHITTAANQTLLLTGDIEKKAEKQILNSYPELKADILQVPHHGSRTSSSAVFLKQLQPEIALFSFGYRNRFRHPSEQVVRRYKEMPTKLYNTGNGAIDIKSNMTNNSFSVTEYRVANRRLWHRQVNQL